MALTTCTIENIFCELHPEGDIGILVSKLAKISLFEAHGLIGDKLRAEVDPPTVCE